VSGALLSAAGRQGGILRALPYIVISLLVYAVLFYMQTYQPDMMTKLLIQVDVFGLTRVADQEQQRLAKIHDLSIPYEDKQVLTNRTVFMGATSEMVQLALGKPTKTAQQPWAKKNVTLLYYVYYLPNDTRPTILVFQDDKLIYAYKGSALDVGN